MQNVALFTEESRMNNRTLYSSDSVFYVHGNACKMLVNGLETERLDHA